MYFQVPCSFLRGAYRNLFVGVDIGVFSPAVVVSLEAAVVIVAVVFLLVPISII